MNDIQLRPALEEDLPILYEFEQGIVTAERPFDETLKKDPINYYDIREMIHAEDTEVIVALCKNELIGSAYVKIKKAKEYLKFDNYAYVGFMFVKPEFRGKGVSQQIISRLKTWAKSKDLNELQLDVYDENLNAIRAYEKFGFKKHMVTMRTKI